MSTKKNFDPEQEQRILAAVVELAEGEPSILLEDVNELFFMALKHHLMDDVENRDGKCLTYLHVHNFLSKLEMIYFRRESCYQLTVA